MKMDSTNINPTIDEQLKIILEKCFEEGISRDNLKLLNEKHLEEIYSYAYNYYEKAFYSEAETLFYLLTGTKPRSSRFWMGLGATFQMQKKYVEAIEAYEMAALNDIKLSNPLPHFYAAECLHSLNKIKRALLAINSAEKIAVKQKNYPQLLKKIKFYQQAWIKQIKN